MLTFLKAVLTLSVLWFIGRSIDIGSALDHASELSPLGFGLVLILLLGQLLVASERLRLVMTMLAQRVVYRLAFRAAVEGNFFSNTFISILGSDAARIWRLQRSGVPVFAATGGVMLDRLIGLTGNHLMLLFALPWLWPKVLDEWTKSGLALLAFGFSGALIAVYLFATLRLPEIFKPQGRWAALRVVFDLSQVCSYAFKHWRQSIVTLFYSLIVNLANVTIFYFLLRDLGVDISFWQCLIVVPVIIQVSLLPISIGGWGVRESAAVIGFGLFGVASHVALAVSVLFGLLILLFSLWGGVWWWLDRHPLSSSKSSGDAPPWH